MKREDHTPSEKELRWTAFLNGEPGSNAPSPDEADGFYDFEQTWELLGTAYCHEASDTDRAWDKLQNKIAAPHIRTIKLIRSVLSYAAIVVLVLGIAFTARYLLNKPDNQPIAAAKMITVTTTAHPDEITRVNLPDGSTVSLNANTKLEYPEVFLANERRIALSGEAFFEVAHDSTCPFIIDTNGASVEVLGTTFNVSAYPGRPTVEVNVESGKVRLTEKSTTKKEPNRAILPAGKSGKVLLASGDIIESDNLSPNYLSWVTKEINFQRTPLAEAFGQLENIYHVEISVTESDISTIPYTANFENLQIDYIVDVIARTHNLAVTRSDHHIVFARKK